MGFAVHQRESAAGAQGYGEQGGLLRCWWQRKPVQPLRSTGWRFLKKLQIEPLYDPAIPPLGIHTEETRIERNMCTPMFITVLYTLNYESLIILYEIVGERMGCHIVIFNSKHILRNTSKFWLAKIPSVFYL